MFHPSVRSTGAATVQHPQTKSSSKAVLGNDRRIFLFVHVFDGEGKQRVNACKHRENPQKGPASVGNLIQV